MPRSPDGDSERNFDSDGEADIRKDNEEAELTRRDLQTPLRPKGKTRRTGLLVGGLLVLLVAWLFWTIGR